MGRKDSPCYAKYSKLRNKQHTVKALHFVDFGHSTVDFNKISLILHGLTGI
jgi:hypothetical protein